MSLNILRVGSACALLGTGIAVAFLLHRGEARGLREENRSLRAQVEQLGRAAAQAEVWSNRLVQASVAQPPAREPSLELLKLRGQVGVLQRQLQELRQQANPSTPGATESLRRLTGLLAEGGTEYERLKLLLDKLHTLTDDSASLVQGLQTSGVAQNSPLDRLLEWRMEASARLKAQRQAQDPQAEATSAVVTDLNDRINDLAKGILLGVEAKAESTRHYLQALQGESVTPGAVPTPPEPGPEELSVDQSKPAAVPLVAPAPASPQALARAQAALHEILREQGLGSEPTGQ